MQTYETNRAAPPVSVGLPVFNGEGYLRKSLDSLLAQTYGDFELIVADNASTDATSEIVREYAARDPRIRQFRHATNTGVGNNWAFVARQARGRLFKWATADDEYAPELLAECVDMLNHDASAVLCFSRTQLMDLEGNLLDVYGGDFAVLSPDPLERYRLVRRALHLSTPIQSGVIRLDAIRRCGFLGNYRESDRVLIAGLALQGKFLLLPAVLFHRRWARSVATPLRSALEIERMYRPAARREPFFSNLPRSLGQIQAALRVPRTPVDKAITLATAVLCTDWRRKFGLARSERRDLAGNADALADRASSAQ